MSTSNVTVTINGNDYPMACAPGEEKKIEALGARIDEVARQVASASGAIAESRLLVMAALILTDQMRELEGKLAGLTEASPSDTAEVGASMDEDKLAEMVEQVTARLEKLASPNA